MRSLILSICLLLASCAEDAPETPTSVEEVHEALNANRSMNVALISGASVTAYNTPVSVRTKSTNGSIWPFQNPVNGANHYYYRITSFGGAAMLTWSAPTGFQNVPATATLKVETCMSTRDVAESSRFITEWGCWTMPNPTATSGEIQNSAFNYPNLPCFGYGPGVVGSASRSCLSQVRPAITYRVTVVDPNKPVGTLLPTPVAIPNYTTFFSVERADNLDQVNCSFTFRCDP